MIRRARARRKLFAAYQVARRSFFEEVAAVVGGGIMILDITGTQNGISEVGAEFVPEPTRH